jgi:EF-hand domain-containing family member B
MPHGHVYGFKGAVDAWNAAKCINGDPQDITYIDNDKDLGKSIKPGCTNTIKRPEDIGRSFGCPTIRNDIPYKAKRSISDFQNYGDEPEAVDLLMPSTFVELGVSEWDFQQPRSRQEIKDLFERIGVSYKIGKFNAIFNKAREITSSVDDKTSVRAFMTAVHMFHDIE